MAKKKAVKSFNEKFEEIKEYARSCGYWITHEADNDSVVYIRFLKEIRFDNNFVGNMVIEHTKYKDPDVKRTDENIFFDCNYTFFAREAREMANEFNYAAFIAEMLDELCKSEV